MKPIKLFRTSLTIPNDLDHFLNTLGLEMRENNGRKLGKTEIIRSLVKVTKKLYENGKLNIDDIKSEEDFEKKLFEAFRKYR